MSMIEKNDLESVCVGRWTRSTASVGSVSVDYIIIIIYCEWRFSFSLFMGGAKSCGPTHVARFK